MGNNKAQEIYKFGKKVVRDFEGVLEQLQDIIDEYTGDNQALNYQVSSLQAQQEIFQQQLEEKDKFIEMLKKNYGDQRDSFERAFKELQECCTAQRDSFERTLKEQQNSFHQAMSEKDASLSAMTDQLHSLKEGLEEEEQRLSDRKAELESWEQEKEWEYTKRHSELTKREERLDDLINEYKEEKAEFEEERNRGTLADENEELKNKVDQLSIENGKWNSQVRNLEDLKKEFAKEHGSHSGF